MKENYENKNAINFYNRLLKNLLNLSNLAGLEIDTLLKKGNILNLIGKWKEAEKIFK